jgi:serine/threonine protein kinase
MIETGKFLQQRYKIDRQIGQGGMGAVYIATDERFGSRVAIKETLFMDDNFRKAIEREARLLNSLKHSVLPRVTDHFEEDNGQFLVMEYIAGDDVAGVLENQGKPFPVETVMKWADQLLDALDYLHNQAIPVVHRDIKPQNLKITPKGDIILLDFGLAKGNPTDAGGQTAAKSIFGYSRNYASLEQIQGTGTDPRSDLYSLAATLYHLLTNVAPEDALTRAMSVLSQKGDPLLPASMVNPSVPRGVAGVLYRAMDLNAASRPSSAAEMREMLRHADDYAGVTENLRAAVTVPGAVVYAQDTRIMPDGANAVTQHHDMKTQILPAYDSEETRVVSKAALAATTDSPRSGKGIGFLAGIGAVLLLGCLGVGAAYLINPALFSHESVVQQPAPQPLPADPNAAANASSDVAVTAPANVTNAAAPQTEAQTGKTNETAKATTKKTGESKNANEETIVEVPADEGDLPAEGMVVVKKNPDGTTSTTRIVRGQHPPVPPTNFNPFPPGFDPGMYQYMTPAQRLKMQELMKRNVRRQVEQQKRMRAHPSPSPAPSTPEEQL